MSGMKHRTAELEGAGLDAAVAKAEGADWRWFDGPGSMVYVTNGTRSGQGHYPDPYAPSKEWGQGGPIIERERICLDAGDGEWAAYAPMAVKLGVESATGPTPLVAAMRAYVAGRLGHEVDL